MARKSKQKQAVLRVVNGTTSHPTAKWIYEEVRQEIPDISLGTVYRNLKLLKREGKILELDFTTLGRFDGNIYNHYHFRCERCGGMFDVDGPVDRLMDDRIAQKTGFNITHHRLEFRGLCKDCQSKTH